MNRRLVLLAVLTCPAVARAQGTPPLRVLGTGAVAQSLGASALVLP